MVSMKVRGKNYDHVNVLTVHISRTRKWPVHSRAEIKNDTLESMKKREFIRLLMMGDFKRGEVKLEMFEGRERNTWGNRLLKLVLHVMTQWL